MRQRPDWLAVLDEAERQAADRFGSALARTTFITSRAAQRLIGSRYLRLPPEAVRVERHCEHCGAAHGKPRFPGAGFDFSVSHADRWLLLAVVGAGRVGVDIEQLTSARDHTGLDRATLTDAEQAEYATLPAHRQRAALLRAWTRKEAAMKLTGLGLAASPRRIDVRADVAVAQGIARWPDQPIMLTELAAPPDHTATLATTVPTGTVLRFALLEPTG
jgi:4'-phosphopantetheinyl transferase